MFVLLNMDTSVAVESRVIMQKHVLRQYVADSRLTQVVTPDGRQYTLNHGKVLVERILAVIEILEFPARMKKICVSIS